MAINYNGPEFGFGNTEKGTLNKGNDIYVTTINDPNALHQFASYNSLFTLSASITARSRGNNNTAELQTT